MQRRDSNPRFSGYGPDDLPLVHAADEQQSCQKRMDHWWESTVSKVLGTVVGTAILTYIPRLWRKLTGRKKSNDAPLPVVAPAAPQTVSASPRDSIPIRDAGARRSDGAVAGYTLDQICESIASRPPWRGNRRGKDLLASRLIGNFCLAVFIPTRRTRFPFGSDNNSATTEPLSAWFRWSVPGP